MLALHPGSDCLVEKFRSAASFCIYVINYFVIFKKIHMLGASGKVSYIVLGNELSADPAT